MDLKTYLESESGVGYTGLAKRLGMGYATLISQWANGVRPVPAIRCIEIERATGGAVSCEELRPDLEEMWQYMRNSRKVQDEQTAA